MTNVIPFRRKDCAARDCFWLHIKVALAYFAINIAIMRMFLGRREKH